MRADRTEDGASGEIAIGILNHERPTVLTGTLALRSTASATEPTSNLPMGPGV